MINIKSFNKRQAFSFFENEQVNVWSFSDLVPKSCSKKSFGDSLSDICFLGRTSVVRCVRFAFVEMFDTNDSGRSAQIITGAEYPDRGFKVGSLSLVWNRFRSVSLNVVCPSARMSAGTASRSSGEEINFLTIYPKFGLRKDLLNCLIQI